MAESKSTCFAFDFKDHSEKSAKFDPFPINRFDADSECAGGPAEALWCVLITLAFAMIVFLTAWHGPDWSGFLNTSVSNFVQTALGRQT
jgi:hypothetical protein